MKGEKKGARVNVTVKRDGKVIKKKVRLIEDGGRALIGITPKMKRSVGTAVTDGVKNTFVSAGSMYRILKQLFTGDVSAKELSGPVDIIYILIRAPFTPCATAERLSSPFPETRTA